MVLLVVDHFTFPHLHFASGSSVALSGELLLYKAECGVQSFGTLHFYKINIDILCPIVLLEDYCSVFTYDFIVQQLLRDIRVMCALPPISELIATKKRVASGSTKYIELSIKTFSATNTHHSYVSQTRLYRR